MGNSALRLPENYETPGFGGQSLKKFFKNRKSFAYFWYIFTCFPFHFKSWLKYLCVNVNLDPNPMQSDQEAYSLIVHSISKRLHCKHHVFACNEEYFTRKTQCFIVKYSLLQAWPYRDGFIFRIRKASVNKKISWHSSPLKESRSLIQ